MSGSGYVNPTYQSPAPQNLQTLLDAFGKTLLKNLNCVRPGAIESFNAANQTAVVRIAQQQVTSVSPSGVQTIAEFPLLLQVPVAFPCGGGFTLTFPIAAGDECILLFNDRQLDSWKLTGAGQPPAIGRMHDLSDALAIMGIRNFTRPLAAISASSTQLRSDDGTTYVEIAAAGVVNVTAAAAINLTAPAINLNASTKLSLHSAAEVSLDADGTGFVYTPTLITTYTDGVSTDHHAPNPPGPL